jgi:hypothetical protein
MDTYRARPLSPAASAFAGAAHWLRFAVCALAFCATAAGAQAVLGINPKSPTLPNAVLGKQYTFTLTADTSPPGLFVFWSGSVSSGEACFMGSGLVFNAPDDSPTSSVTGVPTVPGSYTCTVTATYCNSGCSSARRTYTLNVVKPCTPTQITSGDPPGITAGVPYSFTITATGKTPFSFAAMGLPAGLTLNPTTGVISGTTSVAGSYPVAIIVSGGCGRSAMQNFTLVVTPAPPAPTSLTLSSQPNPAVFTQPVTVVAQASGGVVAPSGSVLLCVAGTGQFCAPPVGAPPAGTPPGEIPPLLSAPLDANGIATFTLDGLLIDTFVLQAYYGGDTAHGPSSAGPIDEFVIKGVLLPPAASGGAGAAAHPSKHAGKDPSPEPIPTLSLSMLALLSLALAGVVAAQLRRRTHGR